MTSNPVVSNSSTLIALSQIGQIELLRCLFDRILIPPAVVIETAPTVELPEWIEPRSLGQPLSAFVLRASLGAGEREAISLALEIDASWLILDDKTARRIAQDLGLSVIGTLGLLIGSKRRGLLKTIRPWIDALVKHDFRVSSELYEIVLRDAGEWSEPVR